MPLQIRSTSTSQVEALGRDNEALALSRAVGWHAENRVLFDGGRTVVRVSLTGNQCRFEATELTKTCAERS